jgi:predicted transcriptional regulator
VKTREGFLGFYADPEMKSRLDVIARRNGHSRSDELRLAIERHVREADRAEIRTQSRLVRALLTAIPTDDAEEAAAVED